jgi:hypothetical protein
LSDPANVKVTVTAAVLLVCTLTCAVYEEPPVESGPKLTDSEVTAPAPPAGGGFEAPLGAVVAVAVARVADEVVVVVAAAPVLTAPDGLAPGTLPPDDGSGAAPPCEAATSVGSSATDVGDSEADVGAAGVSCPEVAA